MRYTAAIKNLLSAECQRYKTPEVIKRWKPNLETQINCIPGERHKHGWTDGKHSWHNIRIPKNAATRPKDNDGNCPYPLRKFASHIGSTGWNWKNETSDFVGFDFDSITGHSPGIGITPDKLQAVARLASSLPYVQVVRSTSGLGLHLYCFLEGFHVKTHTQHAALAKSILEKMGHDTNFLFSDHVDTSGGNLWFWSRDQAPNAYEMLSDNSTRLTLNDVPNWKSETVTIGEHPTESNSKFDQLSKAYVPIELEPEHRRLLADLAESRFVCNWLENKHLIQTHTAGLKKLSGKYLGAFDTESGGNDPTTPNCFCFPISGGGWKVHRFGDVNEPTWRRDYCYFNHSRDYETFATLCNAISRPAGGWGFETVADMSEFLKCCGLKTPDHTSGNRRPCWITKKVDGLECHLKRLADDDPWPLPWQRSSNSWFFSFDVQTVEGGDDATTLVRALRNHEGEPLGFFCRVADGWDRHALSSCKTWLAGKGIKTTDVNVIISSAIAERWTLATVPFAPEFLPGRRWNVGAPQLTVTPAAGNHKTWDKMFRHLGKNILIPDSLQKYIPSGSDYLVAWCSALIQFPFEHLPYLFLYGEQESGKSSMWETLRTLIDPGVTECGEMLRSTDQFNSQLERSVLCVIEELDLGKNRSAYERIKKWVTSSHVTIRKMRLDPYTIPSTCHFFHTSNALESCPVFAGDRRITVIKVDPLPPAQRIQKTSFLEQIRNEGPAILNTFLNYPLPRELACGRMRVPVIESSEKSHAANQNKNVVELFLATLYDSPGHCIPFDTFFDRFLKSLDPADRKNWTKIRVSKMLPLANSSIRGAGNQCSIANLSFEPAKGEAFVG